MADIAATRQALLARKARIELAKQGREMLDQKRTALLQELLEVADDILEEAEALEQVAATARRALVRAHGMAGSEAVWSAALAARGEFAVQVETVNVMGVRVPQIEQKQAGRSLLGRGYAITGTSTAIDEAAALFEVEVEAILRLAESELRLRRLSDEIQSLSRRANALEHVLIPRLERERDTIERVLEERARDEQYRLRLARRLSEG